MWLQRGAMTAELDWGRCGADTERIPRGGAYTSEWIAALHASRSAGHAHPLWRAAALRRRRARSCSRERRGLEWGVSAKARSSSPSRLPSSPPLAAFVDASVLEASLVSLHSRRHVQAMLLCSMRRMSSLIAVLETYKRKLTGKIRGIQIQ
jgi:hypothetical protein